MLKKPVGAVKSAGNKPHASFLPLILLNSIKIAGSSRPDLATTAVQNKATVSMAVLKMAALPPHFLQCTGDARGS